MDILRRLLALDKYLLSAVPRVASNSELEMVTRNEARILSSGGQTSLAEVDFDIVTIVTTLPPNFSRRSLYIHFYFYFRKWR
jgi:hypothetical protein